MTTPRSATWARRERDAARALGGQRVVRERGQSAPDVATIALPSGERLQPEVKHRRRLPRLLVAALAQALRYAPDATPLAVVSEHGGPQLAVLYLVDFARLLGIAPPALPRRARRPRNSGQRSLSLPLPLAG